ncbi:hypothetical protein [Cryobacterium aureum]|uniref:hypothetical protein n=1 Tax=Cryobacterium aureum TaxID=995037 RepID=UPI000CF43BCF|nr:hypothetical protein [Cryobacterium aureum]
MDGLIANISFAVLGAGISLISGLMLERSKRKNELQTRWDQPRLEAYMKFGSVISGALKASDKAAGGSAMEGSGELYEAILILSSSRSALAAQAARADSDAYVQSLPMAPELGPSTSRDWEIDSAGHAIAPPGMELGIRGLQDSGFSSLTSFYEAVRAELGIAALDRNQLNDQRRESYRRAQ